MSTATDFQRLKDTTKRSLEAKGLSDTASYKKRLSEEWKEIYAQDEAGYILDLYDRGVKFPFNQNNLLTPWLLGVVDDFEIDRDPECVYGEYPDIDVDYVKEVRDYLKNIWGPKTFGAEKVCNIGNYSTFGIKMAFLDMAFVHGENKAEINALTKKLGIKDEEGKALSFDKALELYPELKAYADKYPHIAKAVKKMLHRNRGMGKHAGGLIIADCNISDFVPLVKNAKDDTISSAWPEGLRCQELGPVGLIKFDMLVVSDLERRNCIARLIKKRYGLLGVSAKPETPDWDWSDGAYRHDPKALAMANSGDLLGIFQFDSDGIRKLARDGGVRTFGDIVAYSALYRPGPLNMEMDQRYIERSHGREEYEVHPILEPYLGYTYGVMAFQEQVMQMLNHAGGIPLKDCYAVVKAIAKKNLKGFAKYKEQFLLVAMERLGINDDQVRHLWGQIESFAEYGFNKSIDQTTIVIHPNGSKQVRDFKRGDTVYTVDAIGNTIETTVLALHDHGEIEGFEVTFENGSKVICSREHKFLTQRGQMPLWKILETHFPILVDPRFEEFHGECEERRVDGEVRLQMPHQDGASQPSSGVFSVPVGSVASEAYGREGYASVAVRSGVSELQVTGEASAGVRGVRPSQGGEHPSSDGKAPQGQRVSAEASHFFGYGEDNIGKTRCSSRSRGSFEDMAEGQPGQVCKVYRSRMEKSEALQDGVSSPHKIGLGHGSDPLRYRAKTGGFSSRRDLDRGGWAFPFQRAAYHRWPLQVAAVCPGTGRNVERGSGTSQGCYVDPRGDDVFRGNQRRDETRVVPATEGHAGIADSGGLVLRQIVRVVSVGKRRMYDLEVGSDTHNFILAGGVVTSNSHSCAYSYLSSQLLYMKSNYPVEFWAGTLSVESDSPTVDLYRRQADKNGIKVNGIHLNRSTDSFSICPEDDQIYMGFSNIKGVGADPARRIVEARGDKPFGGIEDFLSRFGTDATVLRALIGLRLFKESDPITLMKFVEHFKDVTTKQKQRHQRFVKSVENFQQKLVALLPDSFHKHAKFKEPFFNKWKQIFDIDEEIDVEVDEIYDTGETQEVEEKVYRPADAQSLFNDEVTDPLEEVTVKSTIAVTGVRTVTKKKKFNRWKELKKLWQMQQRSLSQYNERNTTESDTPITLSGFNSTDIELKPEVVRMLRSRKECELEYLGFEWLTAMEQSPDYDSKKPMTYDHAEILASQQEKAMYLQGQLEEVQLRTAKTKNTTYHSLVLIDAMGRRGYINVWNGEWEKFKEELKKGNLVRVLVRPPSNGFSSYSVWGPPRNQPWMAQKHGIVQVATLDKHQDDVLPEDDFERQMSELTGDPDDQCGS